MDTHKLTLSERFWLAAELEDPFLPPAVVTDLGFKYPPFTLDCWNLLRDYQLIGSGYTNTHAQTIAFCFAALIAEEQEKKLNRKAKNGKSSRSR